MIMSFLDKNSTVVIALLLFSVFVLYQLSIPFLNHSKIMKSHVIVDGEFISIGKSEIGIKTLTEYSYSFNNLVYRKELPYKAPCKKTEKLNLDILPFKEKKFSVAVYIDDPSVSLPLLRPKDYELMGMEYPDTMVNFYEQYLDCTFLERHMSM